MSDTNFLEVENARLKWFRHVERMGWERQAKRIMNAKVQGIRPVGRPRTRWNKVCSEETWREMG